MLMDVLSQKCSGAMQVGLAVVGNVELTMAVLTPWRIEGTLTFDIPLAPHKNRGR